MTDAPTTDQPVDRNGPGVADVEQVEARGSGRPGHYSSRDTLDRELRTIKDEVLRMGSLVAAQIGSALEALVSHDADKAMATIVGDGRINEAQRHISSLITTTIATQQPVARDLRLLLSLDHVTYELERMGDHAASVAKQARKLAPNPVQAIRRPAAHGRAGGRPGARRSACTGRSGPGIRPHRGRAATTRSTTCITRSSTRSSS